MPNSHEINGNRFHELVVMPGLMLGVSVTGCLSVPLAFAPDHLGAFVAAAVAGVALWAAMLRLSESGVPCLVDWRAVPTFLGFITFTVRLVAGDQLYALWVVGSVVVLFTAGVVYLNRRGGRTAPQLRSVEARSSAPDVDQISPAPPAPVAA